MNTPKVSVIVPVYNEEMHINRSIYSAFEQTLEEIEIICVDDNSSDSSLDLLYTAKEKHENLIVLRHEKNMGVSAARNTGIAYATGEFIFFMDADDVLPSSALETLYNTAVENGSELVKGAYNVVDNEGHLERQQWASPENKVINTNIYRSRFLQKIPTGLWTYLYKRKLLLDHKISFPINLTVGEDLSTLTNILTVSKRVSLIPDIVYHYHTSETSVMRGALSTKSVLDAIHSKGIIADTLTENSLKEAAEKQLSDWSYLISQQWTRLSSSFDLPFIRQVFSEIRRLNTKYDTMPWSTYTQHEHRYLLSLILLAKDEAALNFLDSGVAIDGFKTADDLRDAIEFVLLNYPGDTGCLMTLAKLSLDEGDNEPALEYYRQAARDNNKCIEAHIQIAYILNRDHLHDEANSSLDEAVKIMLELEDISYAERIISLKTNTSLYVANERLNRSREEIKAIRSELNSSNKKLKAIKRELESVYASRSWRLTLPLRRISELFTKKQG